MRAFCVHLLWYIFHVRGQGAGLTSESSILLGPVINEQCVQGQRVREDKVPHVVTSDGQGLQLHRLSEREKELERS